MADLEEAIHMARHAIDVTQLEDPSRAQYLSKLGGYLGKRYSETGAIADLEEAINVVRQAVDFTPPDHPDRARRLSNLGNRLSQRYTRFGVIADLEDAIDMARQAVNFTPPDHPDWTGMMSNVGSYLHERYSRISKVADLEEAISVARQAVNATPPDYPSRATCLANLGISLGSRYTRTGATADLEEAINVTRQAIVATPPDHPDRTTMLNNLGNRLGDRYSRFGSRGDLEGAIIVVRQALHSTPSDHPDRAGMLNNLGLRLRQRYRRTGTTADLEEAISMIRHAINATVSDHPHLAQWLSNLGNFLGDRYARTGAITDLNEGISVKRQAINSTLRGHEDRSRWLSDLGILLGQRYSRTGSIADLEDAIDTTQHAIDASPPGHVDRAGMLNNLGNLLGDRYVRTGQIADLERAIDVARQGFDATPLDHPHRPQRLSNLGGFLHSKYSRTGAIADLEEAIKKTQQAIDAAPRDYPPRNQWLSNLGVYLGERYSRTEATADLEDAINVTRQAIVATPLDHPDRAGRLNNLGICLRVRYARTGAIADLEEAINVSQTAIFATPPDHPDRGKAFSNLGICLGDTFARTGEIADLEKAITVDRQAVGTTPPDHPDRAGRLNILGILLRDRYARTGAISDLEEAKKCFTAALNQSTAIIRERVLAGRYLLFSPNIPQDQQAYSIAKTTIDLIPLLMTRSLQNTDKRHLLSAAVGLSSDAAAIALHFNQGPGAAIKLLETGRGVIASEFFERSEISALEKHHPEMARSFIDLRGQLDTSSSRTLLATPERPTITAETEGHQRQEAGLQLARLLKTIRSQPNFERFLLPISEADMTKAALYGPIVVLNASPYRYDALIITQSGIRSLPLPHLSQGAINDHVGDLQSLDTLKWLWDVIVRSVLENLGFTRPPSGDQWPHIWWIPTGKLTRFPLHAAGHHLKRSGETALDRVVSSYSSSVKAIIHSRRQQTQALAAGKPHNVVAVAMQHTPNQQPLEFANDEVKAVLAVCNLMGLQHPKTELRKKREVSSALRTCWIFHFAGHGNTHPMEPLHSQLLLEDWYREPLTVASLLETNLARKPPFLAYLSACGTGQILDETSVDESIHLASAFELAGFRHVIGTLWSVDDRLSVDMARMTYEFLRSEGVRDESVSGGLHHATRTLRDQWIDSEMDNEQGKPGLSSSARDGGLLVPERKRLYWVPYVHYGT